MSNNSNSSSNIGVLSLLGVAFVILKLCNVITWSWWYVTMPFWIVVPVIIVISLFTFIGFKIFKK